MNPSYDFAGRVAFVTGAGSGIGLATARAFAEAGASVALVDIDAEALREAEAELFGTGHRMLGAHCDVADEEQVAAAVRSTVDTFGGPDFACNNAGVQSPATGAAEESDRVNAIGLRGIRTCMEHELAQMGRQGSGAIVNCSAPGGFVGEPGRAAHDASKHEVIDLTRSAAVEHAARGVRVNAVCPGNIDTPMATRMSDTGNLDREAAAADEPVGRLGTPEEVAAAVLWLCSPDAGFVVGAALPVDGGRTAR